MKRARTSPKSLRAGTTPSEEVRARRAPIPRISTIQLLVSLVLLFITAPLFASSGFGGTLEAALFTLVLLSAVMSLSQRRRTMVVACALVAPVVIAKWVNHFHPHVLPPGLVSMTAMVFVAFVIVHLLVFVIRSRQVRLEELTAAISGYLLLGFFFALAYFAVEEWKPGSFQRSGLNSSSPPLAWFDALYFSFSTLSTVAFGDILPLSNIARMLAITEATSGMFYMTLFVARLVAHFSFGMQSPSDDASDDR